MKNEAAANADADKAARERVDKLNEADSLIFQTEKQLKEFGEKIPAEKKNVIESHLNSLKSAHQSQDLDGISKGIEALNAAWMAASQDMYNASQSAESTGGPQGNQGNSGSTENVTDVEFEEVNKN